VGATFETTISHSLRQKAQNNFATEESTKNSFNIDMYLDENAKDKQSVKPQSVINFSVCKLKNNQSTCELANRFEEPVAKRRKINIISPGIDSYFSAPSTSSSTVPDRGSTQSFIQNYKNMSKDDKKALGKQYLKDVST